MITCLKYFIPLAIVSLASCSGCSNSNIQATKPGLIMDVFPFKITSTAFLSGDTIPILYTCDSTNISPPLNWTNEYNNTASFAIIMDDPDAPSATWVHWIVYNIPGEVRELPAHLPMDSVLPNGIKQGFTSFRTIGYGGPCPPEGMHRYFFKLYALDAKLNVPARLTKTELLNAMSGHIQGEAELMGRYIRRKKTNN
jgi:Raf kinase inhibitor-like YbhB/YbcL family protein